MNAEEVFQSLSRDMLEGAGEDRPLIEHLLSLLKPRLLTRIEARLVARKEARSQSSSAQGMTLASELPSELLGELTPWHGRKGQPVPGSTLQAGLRVVLADGRHGVVRTVKQQPSYQYEKGTDGRLHTVVGTKYGATVRLDSGSDASVDGAQLSHELEPPHVVPPDVLTDEGWRTPLDVWRALVATESSYYNALEEYERVRSPERKLGYKQLSHKHSSTLKSWYPRFKVWADSNPQLFAQLCTAEGRTCSSVALRRIGLIATEMPRFESELSLILKYDPNLKELLRTGDLISGWYQEGTRWYPTRGTIARIEEDHVLLQDNRVIPLLYVSRLKGGEQATQPEYTADIFLVTLGQKLCRLKHLDANLINRTLKRVAAIMGVKVKSDSKYYSGGSTHRLLTHSGEPFTSREKELLNQVFDSFRFFQHEARFEAHAMQEDPSDMMTDYFGHDKGLMVRKHAIPMVASVFADVIFNAKEVLSAEGELWRSLLPPNDRFTATQKGLTLLQLKPEYKTEERVIDVFERLYYAVDPVERIENGRALMRSLESWLRKKGLELEFSLDWSRAQPYRFRWKTRADDSMKASLRAHLKGLLFDERGGYFELVASRYPDEGGLRVDILSVDELATELALGLHETPNVELSLLGEAYLSHHTLSTQPAKQSSASPSITVLDRTGVPVAIGTQSGSDGCIEMSFGSARYGQVSVTCNRKNREGRRFSNVKTERAGGFYGHDGNRWTMNRIPPEDLLDELRAQGQTFFDVAREAMREPTSVDTIPRLCARVGAPIGARACIRTTIGITHLMLIRRFYSLT